MSRQEDKISFHTSTANAWGMSFLRHLKSEFDHAPDAQQRVMARVCGAAQMMFDVRFHAQFPASSCVALGMCSLMLAAYRELRVEFDSASKAYDSVERSFARAYQAFIRNVCKPLLLSAHPSSLSLDRMNFKSWSDRMYETGSSFHPVASSSGATGYQRFFREHDEPALAHMMKSIDQAWIEAVGSYVQSRRREQSGTRTRDDLHSTGFAPFQFAPSDGQRAAAKHDVVLELQTPVAAPAYFGAERRHSGGDVDRYGTAQSSEVLCDDGIRGLVV
jgi:hypothetical protein